MPKHEDIGLDLFLRDPHQPRMLFESGDLSALSENIKRFGQRVPVIVFPQGEKFVLLDGERRVRALKLAGRPTASAIVLPERPAKAGLRILQCSLDFHRASLTAMERSNLLAEIQAETGWGVTELAEQLSMKQSLASKVLAFQKLAEPIKAMLQSSAIDMERAYIISQVS